MPSVYILFSQSNDMFYTGATTITTKSRLERHLEKYYKNKFTARTTDWELFLEIECDSMKQALLIESHIKRMKSKKYIRNLKKFSAVYEKLKIKYSVPNIEGLN